MKEFDQWHDEDPTDFPDPAHPNKPDPVLT